MTRTKRKAAALADSPPNENLDYVEGFIEAPAAKSSASHKRTSRRQKLDVARENEVVMDSDVIMEDGDTIIVAAPKRHEQAASPSAAGRSSRRPARQSPVVSTEMPIHDETSQDVQVEAHEEDDLLWRILSSAARGKLAGTKPTKLHGFDEESNKIFAVLDQTVKSGEGNSLIIIGSRGSGKSRVVKDALDEIVAKFHTVRLNGFIHTDDKLALREIWRQLGKDLEPSEEDESAGNYADTLAKLLAVLSHPSELGEDAAGTVADSVIFVLDEFDLFATHPRQTLLYNLFDIAQSRKAPIAVVGLTTNLNVVEMLEKRVKSRFSHRTVYMPPATSRTSFRQMCFGALCLASEDLSAVDIDELSQHALVNMINTPRRKKGSRVSEADSCIETILNEWNETMRTFVERPDVAQAITYAYQTSNSYRHGMLMVSDLLDTVHSRAHLAPTTVIPDSDGKLALLPQLALLPLILLICATRLEVILSSDICNFAMAYEEYISLVSRAKLSASTGDGVRLWNRAHGREAWSTLVDLELLIPVAGGGRKRGVGETEMVRVDVAMEDIADSVPDLERGLAKWCKEI